MHHFIGMNDLPENQDKFFLLTEGDLPNLTRSTAGNRTTITVTRSGRTYEILDQGSVFLLEYLKQRINNTPEGVRVQVKRIN